MRLFKDTEILLSRGIKFFLLLIPFIPLYISPSLVFPYITGKNFAFRVLIELAAALWLVLVFIDRNKWFRNSSMLISILSFTFIVGLADLFGVNPYKSFWSNYERMEGFITILHLLLYFIVLSNMFKTKKDWKIFFSAILSTSVLVALFSFTHPYSEENLSIGRYIMEYGTRSRSTIGNPPFLAAYLLLSLFIGIILTINENRYYLRFIFASAVILNSAVIYLTATRGVILGGMAGIIVFIALYILSIKNRNRKNIIKIVAIVTFLAFVSVSIGFFVINDNGSIDQYSTVYRFKTMFSDSSVLTRLDAWKMAMTAIKERPLLGWGQENFISIYTVNPIPLMPEYTWLDRAHNVVIDWLVNAGLLGLLSYIAIFVSAVCVTRSAYSRQRISIVEKAVIVSALAAYFIQNLSLFDTVNSYMIFFALLAYIDTLEFLDKPLSEQHVSSIDAGRTKAACASATFIALILFSITCYYLNYKPMEQSRHIVKMGISSSENDSYSLLLDDFNHALSIHTLGDEVLRESMLHISSRMLRMKAFDRDGALRFIEATLRELEIGIALNWNNLEYLTKAIMFLSEIAKYESSYIASTEVLINSCKNLNPEYQRLDMFMTDVLILKKDYEGAFEKIKKIVEMDPGNDKKQIKLALAAILISRGDIATNAFETVKRIRVDNKKDVASGKEPVYSFSELRHIAENYMLMNNYHQALRYYKEITSQPEVYLKHMTNKRFSQRMSDVYRRKSEIYLAMGEEKKAAEEAKKAEKFSRKGF